MKSLICVSPGRFEYREIAKPKLNKEEALIRIRRIGICGTDLHAFEGTQPFFDYPRILGHELAGELIEADGANEFKPGEIISFIPYFNCGSCIACRSGKPNCCATLKVCGVHADGGMVEYLIVPSRSLLHGNNLTFDELALVEPLAIGLHAVNRGDISPGENVCVIGAGPIGLAAMQFAAVKGANVIAVDVNEARLSFCKKTFSIKHTINAASEDVKQALQEITLGDMPSAVIDATGNLKAINAAFLFMAHGGRYVLVGLQKGDISFSHPEFHKREATLMSSRNAVRKDFEDVIESIKKRQINPLLLITHRFSFDKLSDEFPHLLHPSSGVVKAIVDIN